MHFFLALWRLICSVSIKNILAVYWYIYLYWYSTDSVILIYYICLSYRSINGDGICVSWFIFGLFFIIYALFMDIHKSFFWISKNRAESRISIIHFRISINRFMDIQYSSYLRISKNEWWISKNQFVFMDIHNLFLDIHKSIYGYPIFNWFIDIQKWFIDIQKLIMHIPKMIYGYPKLIYGYP